MYKFVNKILVRDYDNTHKDSSKCINLVVISCGLLEHIKRWKLVNYKEIIHSDYRRYLVDLNIVEYFKHLNSLYDKINKITLNLFKRSHRKKFV